MSHSTCVLDISDDDSSRRAKDDRGKENVPPVGWAPAAQVTKAELPQADLMDRSPLQDLPAAEYFPEGLHAGSYEIVKAVDEPIKAPELKISEPVIAAPAEAEVAVDSEEPKAEEQEQVAIPLPTFEIPTVSIPATVEPEIVEPELEATNGDFTIWESGSFDGEAS
jgi:hypothetical protein